MRGQGPVTSKTERIGKYGDPEQAPLYARREDGIPLEGFSADSIGLWTGYHWGWSPPTIPPSSTHIFISNGELLKVRPNFEALGEKFHRGLTVQNDIRFENYDSYPIYLGQSNEFTFYHRRFYGATIRAELLDEPSIVGGAIALKDPWFEDVLGFGGESQSQGVSAPFHSNTSPWTIATEAPYHGVFLNQLPDPNDPTKPYYSVGAPATNTFIIAEQNYDAYFMSKWEGFNARFQDSTIVQTAVVFTDEGATATAKYKAHLGSSQADATSINSQRKLTQNPTDLVYTLCYPSGGEIWMTQSYDGSTWTQDERVSDNSGGFGTPSLVSTVDDILGFSSYVVYRKNVGSSHEIWSHEKRYNEWMTLQRLDNGNVGADPHPVVGHHNIELLPLGGSQSQVSALLYLWEGTNGLDYSFAYFPGEEWVWNGPYSVPSSNGQRNPSVSSPTRSLPTPLYVTSDNGNNILLRTWDETANWKGDPENVPASVVPTSYNSQVSAEEPYVHVVWEAYGEEQQPPATDKGGSWKSDAPVLQRVVMYQQKYNATWRAAHVFQSSN